MRVIPPSNIILIEYRNYENSLNKISSKIIIENENDINIRNINSIEGIMHKNIIKSKLCRVIRKKIMKLFANPSVCWSVCCTEPEFQYLIPSFVQFFRATEFEMIILTTLIVVGRY